MLHITAITLIIFITPPCRAIDAPLIIIDAPLLLRRQRRQLMPPPPLRAPTPAMMRRRRLPCTAITLMMPFSAAEIDVPLLFFAITPAG